MICDTAGLRRTNDPIENEGVLRAFDRFDFSSAHFHPQNKNPFYFSATNCDILLIVIDVSQLSPSENLSEQINKHLENLFSSHLLSSSLHSLSKLILLNKIDLIQSAHAWQFNADSLPISCLSNVNIEEFLSKLTNLISEK